MLELIGKFDQFNQIHRHREFHDAANGEYFLATYKNHRAFFQKREIEIVLEILGGAGGAKMQLSTVSLMLPWRG